MWITAYLTNKGVPATGFNVLLDIIDVPTSGVLVNNQAMTEVGQGFYKYEWGAYDGDAEYLFQAFVTGGLTGYDQYAVASNRDDLEMAGKLPNNFFMGASTGTDKDDEIDDILADTSVMEPLVSAHLDASVTGVYALIDALNDISQADVQAAMTAQGYTTGRAGFLDYLTTGTADIMLQILGLNDISITDVQTALTQQGYTTGRAGYLDYLTTGTAEILKEVLGITGTIANELTIADVQTAMTNQGYTTGRATNLDFLDAPISSITGSAPTVEQIWSELLPGAYGAGEAGYILGTYLNTGVAAVLNEILGLNDLSIGDVQDAMTAQGYTTGRATLLDNLDAPISSITGSAPTVEQIWSELLPGAYSVGEAGYIVGTYIDAPISGIPTGTCPTVNDFWSELLPGAYNPGEAGYIVGAYLNTGSSDILYLILGMTGTSTVVPAVITGTLTTELSNLLEELHQEKGLGGLDWPGTGTPMDVSGVQRSVPGQWVQSIEADTPVTGTVRVRRVS